MIGVNTRIRGMIGFAMRAGKLVIGTEQVCKMIAKAGGGGIKLVVVAGKASDATRKKLSSKCDFYKIPSIEIYMTPEQLGALIGKTYAPAVIGVADEGFAKEIEAASK
jgi:ribosomal protein L7Ae-like RNA K-turn-binding protein